MLSLFKVFMSDDVKEPLNNVLYSGAITQGKMVDKFEDELKKFLDNQYVLTLNSATSGLILALKLLENSCEELEWNGFNKDTDTVLTPALTCFATTSAVLANGVKLRWIDTDNDTGNASIEDIKNKLSENTKIIYIVHWGGMPIDLDKLEEIKNYSFEKYGFKPFIVEDCAHAFGAQYKNKKLGSNKNICVFSTQAIKHLTTGDGGIITLPNKILYDRCKLLRWYGIDRHKRNYDGKDFRLENDISESGYKFHMNDINATIGLYNLPHIDDMLKKHQNNKNYFDNNLQNIQDITLMQNSGYCLECKSASWIYTMRVKRKTEFIKKMNEKNIMTSQVHNRNDINSCVDKFREKLPNLDILEKEIICIPVGWWITEKDREYIIQCIKNGW